MRLKLTRPLAFIDLETTGINLATDRIVEIAIVKLMPDGTRQVKRKLINPQMPIPQVTTDIHGITDEMVKDAPAFKQVANEIRQFIDSCDLAGYNSHRLDFPLLAEEFLRAGLNFDITDKSLLDVQKVYHMMEPRTLGAAYKFYCDKQLDNAHSAEVDAQATMEILGAQVEKYEQLGDSVESIIKFTGKEEIIDFARRFVMDNGVEVVNFGKHKGRPLVDVLKSEPQYYDWMMKGEFPLHTKQKLTEIFNRTFLKNK